MERRDLIMIFLLSAHVYIILSINYGNNIKESFVCHHFRKGRGMVKIILKLNYIEEGWGVKYNFNIWTGFIP